MLDGRFDPEFDRLLESRPLARAEAGTAVPARLLALLKRLVRA